MQKERGKRNFIWIIIAPRDTNSTQSLRNIYLREYARECRAFDEANINYLHFFLLCRKGYNGTACVLKTLCEVGMKRNDNEPGSFLAEIVRAIFR